MDYKVMYCAESEVLHLGGGTLNAENPFKTYLNFRNNLLLLKKNLPFFRAAATIFVRIWMDLLALFRFLNEGKRKDARAVSRAHRYFFLHMFTPSQHAKKGNRYTHKLTGMFKGSIVIAFFARNKRKFTDLLERDFF